MTLPARASTARSLVWSPQGDGWTELEAGNLVALLHGLRPARGGWSVREIEHPQWVRALVKSGRLTS